VTPLTSEKRPPPFYAKDAGQTSGATVAQPTGSEAAGSPQGPEPQGAKAAFAGTKAFRKLALLTAYFLLLAVVLYFAPLGQLSWYVILVSALAWFGLEARDNPGRISSAMKVGAFLLVFDFIFENSGWLAGLWFTTSQFHVGVVPLQVMGIAFFGGAAWALYLPRRFNLWHSVVDCLVFATFGAVGEYLLIGQVLFVYQQWWTSYDAFAAYFLTWVILHYVRYGVFFRGERRQAR
jgi:hypothetical protein